MLTLRAIADLKGVSYEAVRKRRQKEQWKLSGTVIVKHKETEVFEFIDLPSDIQALLLRNSSPPMTDRVIGSTQKGPSVDVSPFGRDRGQALGVPSRSASDPSISYAGLKQWQRDIFEARIQILSVIEIHQKETGSSLHNSIKAFLHDVSNGRTAHLKRAAEIANNRKGENRLLSGQTIYRWFQIRNAEGNSGLVPADKEVLNGQFPLWLPAFLDVYRQPSKPSIPQALIEMGDSAPAYHRVLRALKKFSNIDIHRGRMSGSELRAHKAYTKRDFSGLLPMDIIVADGHSFKSYVAHPVHGNRFLPEVETIIDVATRAVVGWSTGLAESALIVADAIRHAVTISDAKPMGGLPAIFYADNGSGNRARVNSHEITGILARIGCMCKFGIAGNPQGRGIVERVNQSLWIPAAKKLITYNGHDMDALAQRKRLKIVDKDLKEQSRSRHMLSWPQFMDFIVGEIETYNNRPHSSLPKIINAGGHKRHMTPFERWQIFAAEGWQPDTLNADLMKDLFKPQVEVTTNRGLVRVCTNEYFNSELEHHNGERVFVNYDIHDPNIVWVRDLQQRLICEARWNANRRHYFPIPVIEQARQQRKDRRLALRHEQIREIEDEARGVMDWAESIPEEAVASPTINLKIENEDASDTTERPLFENEIERYEWHLKNGFVKSEDLTFKSEFEETTDYRMIFKFFKEQQRREVSGL